MKIDKNTVVSLHYKLFDVEADQLMESSHEGEPLRYLHGHNNLIPGLETALEAQLAGAKLDVTVAPEEAYGSYQEALVQRVPKEAFAGVDNIEVGARFQAQTEHGAVPVTVTAVEEDVVVVDGNHDLAGKTLRFEVEVVEVRAAEEEEIAHGHVH